MILIADGGSTKVDWRLVDNGLDVSQIVTRGMNPFFCTTKEIEKEIQINLMPRIKEYDIDNIFFYGAGCNSPEKKQIVYNAIFYHIKSNNIEINSDLLAAARGLCGKNPGIACIIGTGSNSCYYNGTEITDNVSPLGYILGDEGSGAVLGRLFIGACLKNQLTVHIRKQFLDEYQLSITDILDKVYRQPMPNRFLASFSPFILKHIDDENIYKLVYSTFTDFFIRNVMQYRNWDSVLVHLTGSVAYNYQDVLNKAAADLNINVGNIVQSPMDGLIQYYSDIIN